MSPSTPSPEDARDVLADPDPVAAFLRAHQRREPVLLRTSGTSRVARGVVRSTSSWVDSFAAVERLTGFGSGSRAWVPAPVSGTMNLFAAVHARYVGAPVVASPDDATHWFLTPSALRCALDRDRPVPRGVHAVVAGDRLDVALHDDAVARGAGVSHYYGAAELSFVAWGAHEGSLTPFPDVEVQVRDGEIWARSPYLFEGYSGTAGALRRDADGFATVGDRGRLVDGRLRVEGRDDVVLTGGATVRVADVEAVLREAATGGVAVLGVLHADLGAVVAVVLERDVDATVLRELSRTALDNVAQPRRWYAVDAFPLTDTGKLDRAALGRLVADGDPAVRRIV